MIRNTKFRKPVSEYIYVGLILILSVAPQRIFAQEKDSTAPKDAVEKFDIKKASFFLPHVSESGRYSHSLAFYYVVPPKDWTLDIVNAPFFNYSGKYTLPRGFNVQGSVSTIFVSNRINAGPFWNYSVNNIHLGVGYQVAFNYGILTQFGFKTTLTGWEQQPSLTIGYNFENTALIVRGDLYYVTALNVNEQGFVLSAEEDFTNGWSVTTSFEQRLYKNKLMSLGVKINYFRYHIIAWPALPVNSYRYVIPEFQICLIL